MDSGEQLHVDHEYIMSPKDLNTLPFIDKIVNTGVKILKIEGRGRSPEYVKIVTQSYHQALKAIESGEFDEEFIKNAEEKLERVFNRGFWDGYYLGQRLGEWSDVYGSAAKKRKHFVGRATNYFSRIGVAEFKVESGTLKKGDEILIIGPTTGVIETSVGEIRVDEKPVDEATRGERCSIPVDTTVRRSDKLYQVIYRSGKNEEEGSDSLS